MEFGQIACEKPHFSRLFQTFLMSVSESVHVQVMRYSCPSLIFKLVSSPKETTMKEWLKPEITESEAGMEVTSYLPAELDRA